MPQGLLNHPLIHELLSLDLPLDEFAVAGSGPLLAHGLSEEIGDLDVLARGTAWARAQQLGTVSPAPSGNGTRILVADGRIEIFDTWLPGPWSTERLIDEARLFSGIRFTSLEFMIAWKTEAGRDKDGPHVELARRFLSSTDSDPAAPASFETGCPSR